jgi:hypothetical protein
VERSSSVGKEGCDADRKGAMICILLEKLGGPPVVLPKKLNPLLKLFILDKNYHTIPEKGIVGREVQFFDVPFGKVSTVAPWAV